MKGFASQALAGVCSLPRNSLAFRDRCPFNPQASDDLQAQAAASAQAASRLAAKLPCGRELWLQWLAQAAQTSQETF